ncbi:IS30 family transposase [Akkermansiaceae bacterium]|nr:IS30 family transposase [Akkermansiaceae bacterium]
MKHITSEERHTIAHLLGQNKSPAEIARELNRHKSTIKREIDRNCDQRDSQYRYDLAQRKASNRKKSKATRNSLTKEMIDYLDKHLMKKFSPEQIVGVAKRKSLPCVSHETIYLYIWNDKKEGGKLYQNLRNEGKRYRKRGAAKDRRGIIANKTPMTERPEVVEKRERLGDLEIDLVIGKGHQGALLTINDRVSGLLIVEQLQGKSASEVTAATIARLEPFKKRLHTITSDNGKEFAGHEQIAAKLEIDFYFAKPYHSWERGSNEHLNGLIRQYIPKDTNILELESSYIKEVEHNLNSRPRKRHGYHSPYTKHQQLTKEQKVALTS